MKETHAVCLTNDNTVAFQVKTDSCLGCRRGRVDTRDIGGAHRGPQGPQGPQGRSDRQQDKCQDINQRCTLSKVQYCALSQSQLTTANDGKSYFYPQSYSNEFFP